MNTSYRHQIKIEGFVALMGSIVISMVLLMIATEAVLLGWSTRFMLLTAETNEMSVYLAHQCADQTMSLLLQNPQYLGGETISYDTGVCQIEPLSFTAESNPLVTVRLRVLSSSVIIRHEYQYQLTGIKIGDSLPASTIPTAVLPSVQMVSWREW